MNRFRPARTQDIDAILPMMRRYYEEDGYAFDEDTARAALAGLLGDERLGRLWVAEVAGCVAGYVAVTLGFSLEYGGRDAFLDELCVDPASRGQGLGREAVDLALEYCRHNGVRALHLEVEEHRLPARHIYEAAGFASQGRVLLTRRP